MAPSLAFPFCLFASSLHCFCWFPLCHFLHFDLFPFLPPVLPAFLFLSGGQVSTLHNQELFPKQHHLSYQHVSSFTRKRNSFKGGFLLGLEFCLESSKKSFFLLLLIYAKSIINLQGTPARAGGVGKKEGKTSVILHPDYGLWPRKTFLLKQCGAGRAGSWHRHRWELSVANPMGPSFLRRNNGERHFGVWEVRVQVLAPLFYLWLWDLGQISQHLWSPLLSYLKWGLPNAVVVKIKWECWNKTLLSVKVQEEKQNN